MYIFVILINISTHLLICLNINKSILRRVSFSAWVCVCGGGGGGGGMKTFLIRKLSFMKMNNAILVQHSCYTGALIRELYSLYMSSWKFSYGGSLQIKGT